MTTTHCSSGRRSTQSLLANAIQVSRFLDIKSSRRQDDCVPLQPVDALFIRIDGFPIHRGGTSCSILSVSAISLSTCEQREFEPMSNSKLDSARLPTRVRPILGRVAQGPWTIYRRCWCAGLICCTLFNHLVETHACKQVKSCPYLGQFARVDFQHLRFSDVAAEYEGFRQAAEMLGVRQSRSADSSDSWHT